jgi:5'-nucleotidase
MKLLLTNDDGADAPGMTALRDIAATMGDVIVSAPAEAMSGCSHSATTDRPIRVVDRSPSFHVVEGTPADCVRVALHRFAGELDWVLSGVNDGGNLGVDVYHSGTVAAVREAGLRGVPGIAISHYHNRPLVGDDWKRAARWGKPLVRQLMARAWIKGTYWNINFPSLDPGADDPQVVFCPLDPSPLLLDFKQDAEMFRYNGRYSHRERLPGTDVDVCFGGAISVTQVSIMEPSR